MHKNGERDINLRGITFCGLHFSGGSHIANRLTTSRLL